jgi:predicted NBD/HSP70 family sugar kinase
MAKIFEVVASGSTMPRLSSRQISQLHLYQVLHAVRLSASPMSRAEICGATGLSQPAVSSLTRRLLATGALMEVGARPSSGGGRREREFALNPDFVWVVGVDISLHHLTVTLTDFTGAVRRTRHAPLITPMRKAAVIKRLVKDVRACLAEAGDGAVNARLAGVGIALPGFIDSMGDEVHWSAVFETGGSTVVRGLSDAISQQLGVPVFVENDANIRALAEQWFGVAGRLSNVAVITLEQGLGLGLVINGELYRGRAGLAAELAHVQVEAGGRQCHCGKRGCLEAYVSHYAVVRQGQEEGLMPRGELPPQAVDAAYEKLARIAKDGNSKALAIFERQGRQLGSWIGNVVNLLAPQLVILDGGRATAIELFEAPLRAAMDDAMALPHRGRVPLVISHEDGEAWARGAASLVLQRLDESADIVAAVSRHGFEDATNQPAARRAAA